MKQLAQIDFGELKGFGPLGNPQGTGISTFSTVISTTVGIMTIVAFLWFLFTLVTGAISIMTAGGDKSKLENARNKITNGIVGLVVVIAAIFIFDLIGTIFGIKFLDLQGLFNQVAGIGNVLYVANPNPLTK